MQRARVTGPGAGVEKYDLLTALSLWGLRAGPTEAQSVLRLSLLVTARYNWARDEVSVGQKDLSRLWGVCERTVKREMKRLITLGILEQLRPGVRGRVGAYRLDPGRIAALSAPHWHEVGPDFTERQQARQPQAAAEDTKVVAFPGRSEAALPADPWSRVLARLRQAAPEAHGAWFSRLSLAGLADGQVVLAAPSGFVARYIDTHYRDMLAEAVAAEFGAGRRLVLN